MAASSQPLASSVGTEILRKGGNAADAAVAVASALNVLQPTSTGIGGDCFCLFWDAKEKVVKGMNASGRAPANLNLEYLQSIGITKENPWNPVDALCVTVPGAAAGWVDCIENFGSGNVTLHEVLKPAIDMARNGFPVGTVCALDWKNSENLLKGAPNGTEMLLDGTRSPEEGEVMKLPNLAQTFEDLALNGKKAFYEGRIADSIVQTLKTVGGVMELEDLKNHVTTFVDPIKIDYKGHEVYEIPPNGQGIAALMALNIFEEFDLSEVTWGSTEHLHIMLECMRLAFSDASQYVADPEFSKVPVSGMLSKEYARERRNLISRDGGANLEIKHGYPDKYSGTVYFCVVDGEGNACSFINSNYMGFGSGIVPQGCGFTLQNRGHNFSLDPEHPNHVAPKKRSYHTIIPGMIVKNGQLFCPFGVMGGFMQPQGHFQVVSNLIDWKMSPQKALDAPRFLINGGTAAGLIYLEDGIKEEVLEELKKKGHYLHPTLLRGSDRCHFGIGQIIIRDPESGVLKAGSDPRHDGQAVGY
eukprot:TRINITY_DN1307_c0_g4_i1.p1 TRINITY_DN1307_c0_g4~~TRINITY_DN1307_c0_g4_i1.p1  ORF type:complete len:555 (-),score=114.83 TRINITY_DN1307_c0_g4_i1:120-1706(-)